MPLENPEFMKVGEEIDRNADADVKSRLFACIRARLGARVSLRGESGFTLMEAVIAMMLFALIATAMLSVLTAGVSAQRLSRQRTIAEQASTAQAEYIRTLSYSNVGNPGGNPSGTIPLTQSVAAVLGATYPGLTGTVTTRVEWNNNPSDKVATAYRNAAFYKKVTITVTRSSDGKQLAQMVTYVSNTNAGTGVAESEIDLNVLDIGSNTPLAGQLVNLTTGPSAPLSDTTDSAGNIVFPALTANPTSGPTAYYNLSMTPLSGYTLLKDDDIAKTPTAANAHIQLAPSQTFPTTLRVYKGSTISVVLQDQSTSSTYTGNATVTLSTTLRGTPTSQNYSYSGGPLSTTTFPSGASSEPIIPAPSPIITGGYTASVSNGFFATSVNKATVPNAYPSDLTSTFTLTGYPTGTLTATVTWAGSPVSGAVVTLTGGPTSVNQSASTNGSGVATFTDLPAGSGYSLSAQKSGEISAATPATVVAGSTTNVPVAMPVGTVAVTVTSAGSPIVGATVTLTGGNISGTITAGSTTDVNGQVTITNVPKGSGVTVTATKGPQSGSTSPVTVPNGATVTVSVLMPLGSIAVTANWGGSPVANCVGCVKLSGGALGSPVFGDTDAAGKVTFINVPATSGYTVDVTKAGQTGTTSGITVTGGATTPVTVNMPVGSVTVTVTWAGSAVSGATVQLSGGNITGTITAGSTTNGSGQVTVANVPVGSGVTGTATKSGQTGTTSGQTVTAAGPNNVAVAMPVGSVTVTVTWAGNPVTGATVTLTGGNISGTITAGSTTNSSGQVTVANVPVGSGVTVQATASGQTGTTSGQTVTTAGPNNVAVTMPVGTFVVTAYQPAGTIAPGATVTLTLGPMSVNVSGTADSLGQVTFSNVPAGSGYTITASRYGTSANVTNQSVAGSGTTNVTVNIANYSQGSIKITVKNSLGATCNATKYNWTITGGTYSYSANGTATTNASGVLGTFGGVPATSGYTVTATNFTTPARTGSTSSVIVTSGGTANVTVTLVTVAC